MYPNHGHFGLFDIFDHSLIYNSMCLFILIITHTLYMHVSENSGFPPKMDGENNGKPYVQMDDLGGVHPLLLECHPHWTMFPSVFLWSVGTHGPNFFLACNSCVFLQYLHTCNVQSLFELCMSSFSCILNTWKVVC